MHRERTCTIVCFLALTAACGSEPGGPPADDAGLQPDAPGDGGVTDPFESECAERTSSVPGLVTTRHGDIQGVEEDNGVWQFLGIPFAAPPVGELRWRPPVEPGCFPDPVLVADAFGPACPQLSDYRLFETGDPRELPNGGVVPYTAERDQVR